MLLRLLYSLERLLRTQSADKYEVKDVDRPGIDVMQLEERIMYSAVPFFDPALLAEPAVDVDSPGFSDPTVGFDFGPVPQDDAGSTTEEVAELELPTTGELQPADVRREVLFIDSTLPDFTDILDDLVKNATPERDIDVILLDPSKGIEQISNSLRMYSDVDAIHIFSHGSPGAVQIGNTILTSNSLQSHAGEIASWGVSLAEDADLLLYGCDLANADGDLLIDSLAALCDCDVAASDDLTGHADLGGDWEFEYIVGTIESTVVLSDEVQQSWHHLLNAAPIIVDDGFTPPSTGTTSLNVTANDSDGDGGTPVVIDFTDVYSGTLVQTGSSTFDYTPGAVSGDSFMYRADDGQYALAHYYGLAGNGNDSVGTNHATSIVGAATVDGSFGDALWFDEVDDRVVIPDFNYTNEFTVSFDFRIDDNTGTTFQYLFSHGTVSTANSLNIYVGEATHGSYNNQLFTNFQDSNDAAYAQELNFDIASIINDGLYHNYTMTVDATNGTSVYLDGVLMANQASRGGDAFNPTTDLYVGGRNDMDANRYFGGGLDSLRFHDRDLTAAEVADQASSSTPFGTVTIAMDEDPTDLSTGIELNTDSGNDAYLVTNNAQALLGGATSVTLETSFSSTSPDTQVLFSYETDSQINAFLVMVENGGAISVHVNNVVTSFSNIDYHSLLTDGQKHHLAVSWDSSSGSLLLYIDGEFAEAAHGVQTAGSLSTHATSAIVLGKDQDGVDTGYDATQSFAGTLYDARLWNTVRSQQEIALNQKQKFVNGSLPTGLIANWQMTGLTGGSNNIVVDVVNAANNLTVDHASGGGFTSSTPIDNLNVTENAADGSSVGFVAPSDPDVHNDIVSGGLFLNASGSNIVSPNPVGDWTVTSGSVDVTGYETGPLGGKAIDMNGSGSAGTISQTLATEAGRQYQVVFGFSGNWSGGQALKDLQASIGGVTHDFQISEPTGWMTTNMLWENRSFNFIAESSATDLAFTSLDAGEFAGPMITDVQVIEIPAAVTSILNSDSTLSYDAATGKFYRYVGSATDFDTALDNATVAKVNGISGQLLTVRSQYENQLIQQIAIDNAVEIWLGTFDSDNDGNWSWLEGGAESPDQFWSGGDGGGPATGAFAPGFSQSNLATEDYARLQSDGNWSDHGPDGPFAYVIEWDATEVLSNYSYTLTDASGRFTIDSSTGEILVADASLIDFEDTTSHSVSVGVTDAAGNTYSESFSIAVNNRGGDIVQSIPVATQPVTEDGSRVFSSGNSNAITVTDSSSATNSLMQVNLSVTNGTLTLSQTTGLSFAGGSNGSSVLVINGTEADINAALEGLTYAPTTNFNGSDTLTVTSSTAVDLDGLYTFEGGNANDQSVGISNNGSLLNGAGTTTDLDRGEVLQLDGVNQAVQITGLFGSPADVSLAAWVNVSSGASEEIISLGDSVLLRSTSGTQGLQLYLRGTSTWQSIDTGVNLNGMGWTHVAATVDDATGAVVVYINGESVATATAAESIQYNLGTDTFIGSHGNGGGSYLNGLIDEARIYTRTLTADEIAAVANGQADATGTVNISISAANDAPVITNAASVGMGSSYAEDGPTAAFSVSGVVSSVNWSDADAGAVRGMAVTSTTGNGTWQYSTDGSNWTNIGTVASNNALLLSSTSSLRYVGDNLNGETPEIQFRAWDETSGSASTFGSPSKTDPGVGGGTTAYSTGEATATTTITSVNDAPTLDNSGTMTLTTITEDAAGNAGNTIADIIATAGGNRIADVDSGAVEGIAITATTNSNGVWQYSVNGGSNWTDVGVVSNGAALLLRSTDLVRFNPDGTASATPNFTFRAWDQSSGTEGTKVDTSTNGGPTAFSTATESATISVTDVNDAPTLTSFAAVVDTTNEDTEVEVTFAELVAQGNEADVDGTVDAFVVKSVTSGSLRIGSSAGTATAWAAGTNDTINGTLHAYWTPGTDLNGTQNAFAVVAEDDGGLESTPSVTAQVSVTPVNDAPTLSNFAAVVETTDEDTEVEVSFADLAAQGNEADIDGTVDAFVVQSVTSGTLRIGTSAGTATAWAAGTNDVISSTLFAYWTPAASVNGTQNAFDVVARDDGGLESSSNVTAQVSVTPVNDPPTLSSFAAAIDTTNEDTEVELTFAEFAAQGNEADIDGTVTSFVVKNVETGTLRIGTSAGTATAWAAGTNDEISATLKAYWTPALNSNGAQNAVAVVAKDDGGLESSTNITAQVTVNAVNDAPTLTSFAAAVDTTNEDTEVEVTFAELVAQGNEADVDGTVDAFIVKSVTSGSLRIGSSAGTATAWAAGTNDTINGTLHAYWSPGADLNGTQNAFAVVAEDDGGLESTPSVTAQVSVTPVNDAPTLTNFAAVVEATNEDTEVEVSFADLAAQGNEADIDGTVDAFVVQSVTSGTLRIGTSSGTATAWAAGTNDVISSTLFAYWTPAASVNGTQNAFDVVARDDGGLESSSNVTAQVSVTPVNDPPTLSSFAAAIDTTNEDTEVELTFAEFAAQGNEADIDGTVTSFVVKNVDTGTLRIGTSAGTATAWAAGTNDEISATLNAYWTPALNSTGAQNAVAVVAKDDGGLESSTNITAQVAVNAVNDVPTLTSFAAVVDTTNEDTEVEVTFAELVAQGNEADVDGTVDAFIVKSVTSGTLRIGTSAGTATAWATGTNDTISGTLHAYWTPGTDLNGTQNAFAVVAEDDGGLESTPSVTAQVSVTPVNDAPTLTNFVAVVETTNEDTEVEVSFADLAAQGNEADIDGTVDAFVVQSVATGTLRIGTSSGTATAWAAGTNDVISSTLFAYWTPAASVNGTQNAFDVVARDDGGLESSSNVTAQVSVTPVNDPPTLSSFAAAIDTTNEDTEVELTFAEFAAQGNEADIDGTVTSFVVKNVETGTLRIGTNAGTATAWAAGTNDEISATLNAYWTPALNLNGTQNAVAVVAKDDGGLESSTNITAQVAVNAVNDAPALTSFAAVVDTTNEDTEVEVTFAELVAQGNEADVDGTVDAFIVRSVTSGTLRIGTSAGTATAWAAGTNDTINGTLHAYWTPGADLNGTQNAFAVVAEDDGGLESTPSVTAQVSVTPVNDAPTLTNFAAVVETTNEDTEVEVSFADLAAQGNEADIDGTVDTFVVQSVATGTLRIGTSSGTATAWAAGTNDEVSSTLNAFWTPDLDVFGTQNAFNVVAKDDGGLESTGSVLAQISVTATNDDPVISTPGSAQTFIENGPPVTIDNGITVTDVEMLDFDTATLTVSITNNGTSDDRLVLENYDEYAPGRVGITGDQVRRNGNVVGTISGGSGVGDPLVITFNAFADADIVAYTARQIQFTNYSNDPSNLDREVSFTVTDGDGGTSATVTQTVLITASNDAPEIATSVQSDDFEGGTTGWTDNSTFSNSELSEFLAQQNPGTGTQSVSKTFTLPADSDSALVTFDFYEMDSWDSELFKVFINDVEVLSEDFLFRSNDGSSSGTTGNVSWTITPVSGGIDNMGLESNFSDQIHRVELTITNPGTSLKLGFGSTLNSDFNDESYGIDNLNIQSFGNVHSYTEDDGAVTFLPSSLIVADLDDSDIEAATIQITGNYVDGQDVLAFTNQNGITGTWTSASGTLVLSGTATKAEYEAALESITYANNSQNPSESDRTISITINDGTSSSATLNSTIQVTAVNDVPTISNLASDSLSYTEDDGAVVIDQGADATALDVDSSDFDGGSLVVSFFAGSDSAEDVLAIRNQGSAAGQVGVSGSNVTFGGTTIGTFAGGSGGVDLSISFNANADAAAVTQVLQNITYENTDTDNPTTGARAVNFVVSDGDGGSSIVHAATVNVSALNDAPVITSAVGGDTYVENAPGTFFNNSLVIADVDVTDFDGGVMTVTITGNGDPAGNDRVTILDGGNVTRVGDSVRYDFGGGPVEVGLVTVGTGTGAMPLEITFDADANASVVEAVAQRIVFLNSSDDPHDLQRTMTMQVTDGDGGTSNLVTRTMDVTAVNDAPVDGNAGSFPTDLTVTEDIRSNLDLSSIDLQDADERGLNLTVTLTTSTGGNLYATTGGGVTVAGDASDTLTLTGSLANLNTFLNSASNIQYQHATANLNGDDADTVTVVVNDNGNYGTGGGTNQSLGVVNIDIAAVNDTPVVTGPGSALSATEQLSLAIHGTGFSVSDLDASTGTMTATIAVGEGAITIAEGNSGVILGVGNGTGSVTFTGTLAEIDNLLTGVGTGAISYLNSSDTPSASTTITVTVNDGGNTGSDPGTTGSASTEEDSAAQAINITAANDDPTNLGSLPALITVTEDVAGNVDLSSIDLSDVDHGGGNLTITLSTSTGGNLSATSSGGVVVGGSSSALTLTGTQADLNTFLNSASSIQYLHGVANTNGSSADTIQINVNDNGNNGTGGGLNVSFGSVNVDIIAINDDPTNSGSLPTDLTVNEDLLSNVDLSSIDLGDVDHGGISLTLKLNTTTGGNIYANSSGGVIAIGSGSSSLWLQGDLASLNAFIDNASNINYQHSVLNMHGDNVDIVTVSITDNGGTGLGGGTDIPLGSVNIDITELNDAPNVSGEIIGTFEDTPVSGDVSTNDSDPEGDTMSFALVSAPTRGGVVLNTDGTFTYTPSLDFYGTDFFVYEVSDGQDTSIRATTTLTVASVNDSPVATSDSYSGLPGQTLSSTNDQGLLLNDTDVDGDSLSAVLITGPSSGSLVLNSDGSFTYTPAETSLDDVTFSYAVTDGILQSNTVTVTLSFAAAPLPDDPPSEPESPKEEVIEQADVTSEADAPTEIVIPSVEIPAVGFSPSLRQLDIPPQRDADEPQRATENGFYVDHRQNIDFRPTTEGGQGRSPAWKNATSQLVAYSDYGAEYQMQQLQFALDSFVESVAEMEVQQLISTRAVNTFVIGATAGTAIWMTSGSYLAAMVSSSLPAWAAFDPIMVIRSRSRTQNIDDSASMADLIKQGALDIKESLV